MNDGYAVDVTIKGSRYRKRGFPTARAASDFIQTLQNGIFPPAGKSASHTIREYLAYGQHIQRKSPKTLRSEGQRLGVFSTWAGDRSVASIDVQAVREFQAYYFDNAPFTKHNQRYTGNPAATWEKYRQNLSALFNWCTERGLMPDNPLSKRREFVVASDRKIPRIFSKPELEAFLNYIDGLGSPHLSAAYRILAYTGCRLSEMTNLTWDRVNVDAGEIHFAKTKNHNDRIVPIHPKLAPYLDDLPRGKYVIGDGAQSKLYHDNHYYYVLQKACAALDMPSRRVHDLRHTFGSMLVEADVNLATVKELMGHKRIETTLIYLQFSKKTKNEALLKLPY